MASRDSDARTAEELSLLLQEQFQLTQKKSQKKWEDFVIQFTNDATLIASHEYSSINKNTAHLWRIKMMRCLGEIVSSTILNGNVWIDEIYFDVNCKMK